MSVLLTFWRSSKAGGGFPRVSFEVATAPTCCLVETSFGFLMWNLMCLVCWQSTSRGATNVTSRLSTCTDLAAVSLPIAWVNWLNLSNAVPMMHPRQHRCCKGPAVTSFPITPCLMRRIPSRKPRTLDGSSNGLDFPLTTGDVSFVGSVLMIISLIARSCLENAGAPSKMSSIMMGPRRFLSLFFPLEKPFGFLSFLECFILQMKAFCNVFELALIHFSLTREALLANRLAIDELLTKMW
jgi:hypothetical protein